MIKGLPGGPCPAGPAPVLPDEWYEVVMVAIFDYRTRLAAFADLDDAKAYRRKAARLTAEYTRLAGLQAAAATDGDHGCIKAYQTTRQEIADFMGPEFDHDDLEEDVEIAIERVNIVDKRGNLLLNRHADSDTADTPSSDGGDGDAGKCGAEAPPPPSPSPSGTALDRHEATKVEFMRRATTPDHPGISPAQRVAEVTGLSVEDSALALGAAAVQRGITEWGREMDRREGKKAAPAEADDK